MGGLFDFESIISWIFVFLDHFLIVIDVFGRDTFCTVMLICFEIIKHLVLIIDRGTVKAKDIQSFASGQFTGTAYCPRA